MVASLLRLNRWKTKKNEASTDRHRHSRTEGHPVRTIRLRAIAFRQTRTDHRIRIHLRNRAPAIPIRAIRTRVTAALITRAPLIRDSNRSKVQ